MTTDTDIIIALARKLESENDRLRAENAALRAGQGTWPDGDDWPAGDQVPRAISSEELRVGQVVTGRFPRGHWCEPSLVRVSELDPRRVLVIGDDGYYPAQFSPLVLLADAPKSEPTVAHDDDGKPWGIEVRPVADPAPRLTVHALNTAPVGSVVTGWGVDYTKHYDGQWCDNTGRLWSDGEVAGRTMVATLTYPEATP